MRHGVVCFAQRPSGVGLILPSDVSTERQSEREPPGPRAGGDSTGDGSTTGDTRPASEPRGGGVGAGGDDGVRGRDRAGDPRRPPPRRGLLPRPPPGHVRRDQGAVRALRADRRADGHRAPRAARGARRRRRQGRGLGARLDRPRAGQRAPLRPDREAERAAAPAARRRAVDPVLRPRARGRARGARRGGGAAAVQGRPRGARERLPPGGGGPRRGDRPARAAREGRHRAHRRAVRVPRPRLDDRRLPAREPRRDRSEAGDGEILDRRQHRRARLAQARPGGRVLLARDVGDRARAPLHRRAGADRERPVAQGEGRDRRTGREWSGPATS